ncbi:MAG: TonB-dependent receptor plug domain-containing protein [Flavisolibacter sp.]
MRKSFVVAALIISSLLQVQAFAQKNLDSSAASISDESASRMLDPIVITTNKYPKKQSQTGKVVTVIDRITIEKLGGHTLGELLNTAAGVTINGANNTLGTNQRISIRGSSDGNVLLLIDGIPANDPSVISNYFDLNFINTSQIERIEILKGGQSTLYGSDAVSGVINIITKKTDAKQVSPYASASYGSYSTFNGSVGVRGQSKIVNYNLMASGTSSKGFSSAYDSIGHQGFDRDGYHQSIFRGDIGLKLSDHLQWNFIANYSRYKAGIDAAAFTDDKDFTAENRNWQAGTGLLWKQNHGGLHVNYYFNYVSRFYLDDSTDRGSFAYYSKSTYIGRTHFAELYENYRWNRFEFLLGGDYRYYNTNQVYNSISVYGPFDTELSDALAKMRQSSLYGSAVYSQNGLNVELGGRFNHHSTYGNNSTYTFNPSYLIDGKVKLFANLSTSFKTPTLFELFDAFSGNKNLEPERSTITEGGVETYIAKSTRLRATVFHRNTKNAIQYIIINPTTYEGHYYNTNEQKSSGVELEFNYQAAKWKISANYAYTKGKVSSAYSESGDKLAKDTTYNNLYRVPDHAFNSFISYNLSKAFSISTLVKYVGKRFEPIYASAPRILEDYFTIDLDGQYAFNENFIAFIDLKNITNTKYFDVLGYNSRRFNFTVGTRFRF